MTTVIPDMTVSQRVDIAKSITYKARVISKTPYGYHKAEDGTVVVHKFEAEVVREVYRLLALGHGARKVATLLSNANIPTPMYSDKKPDSTVTIASLHYKNMRRQTKGKWHHGAVQRMVDNAAYYRGEIPGYGRILHG